MFCHFCYKIFLLQFPAPPSTIEISQRQFQFYLLPLFLSEGCSQRSQSVWLGNLQSSPFLLTTIYRCLSVEAAPKAPSNIPTLSPTKTKTYTHTHTHVKKKVMTQHNRNVHLRTPEIMTVLGGLFLNFFFFSF